MKISLFLIALLVSATGIAGPNGGVGTASNPLNANNFMGAGLQEQRQAYARQEARQEAQAQYDAAVTVELNKIYSKDQWRKIGESTVLARGTGWVEFQGKVEEARPDGAILRGKWGPVLTVFTDAAENEHFILKTDSNDMKHNTGSTTTHASSRVQDASFQRKILYGDDLFFVENFPYPSSSGDAYEKMMALDSNYYSYTNSAGRLETVHKLVYGTPCVKTWSAEEIAAAKQKADSKKKNIQDKILKSYQDSADRNEPYGWLRLGECYRDGELGVEKDLAKAKVYLTKAADAGSTTAANELSKLSQ